MTAPSVPKAVIQSAIVASATLVSLEDDLAFFVHDLVSETAHRQFLAGRGFSRVFSATLGRQPET
jgi:hypothetical protein